MTTQTKKLLIQTILLLAVFVITWVLASNLFLEDSLFYFGVDFAGLFVLLHLALFIFLPVTVLHFMRKKSSEGLGKLFRFTAYLIFFILLILFFTNFLPNVESVHYAMVSYDMDEYILEESILNLLVSTAYLVLAILMYFVARINKSLDEKFSLIPMKENRELFLIISSILLVLIISLYLWYKATNWAYLIEGGMLWYEDTELARMAIRDTYSLVFKKIALIGGFIFTSTFLLLKVIKDKK